MLNPRLAIISTHPIQYNAPFFSSLAQINTFEIKVFYTWGTGCLEKYDPGFNKTVKWDIPLLEGYEYTFLKNVAKKPGSHHFCGIDNPTIIKELKTFDPNAIMIYGWNFRSHLKVIRYFKNKIPLWFRGDSTLLDYDYRSLNELIKTLKNKHPSLYLVLSTQYVKFIIRRLFLTWIFKHIDKAFYVGTNNKNYYLVHGLKEKQLVWLPHAVNNDFFQKDSEKAEEKAKEWRKSLGIKEDDFVVLYAGKFEPVKNLEILIKAIIELNESIKHSGKETQREKTDIQNSYTQNEFEIHSQLSSNEFLLTPLHLDKAGRELHLILIGNGILEQKLKNMAAEKEYIHFLPFQNQSQMPLIYRIGDIFCLPSKSETWGLAVNEAMACGTLVIVSNKVGCAIDLVKDDKIGIVFKSNDKEDLIKAIKTSLFRKQNNNSKNLNDYDFCTKIIVDEMKML